MTALWPRVRQIAAQVWKLAGCLLAGNVCGSLLVLLVLAPYAVTGCNFYTVLYGRVYRSAQPTPHEFEEMTAHCGIRTVLNLRGAYTPKAKYREECQTLARLGVEQHDFQLSSLSMAPAAEAQRFVAVLDQVKEPVLLHCHSGGDRTGWAATVALLVKSDVDLEEARSQLNLRFGHKPFGRVCCWDRFFDQYQGWLAAEGTTHTPHRFRLWLRTAYIPEPPPDDFDWQAIKLRYRATGPLMGTLDFCRRLLG